MYKELTIGGKDEKMKVKLYYYLTGGNRLEVDETVVARVNATGQLMKAFDTSQNRIDGERLQFL